MWHRYSSCGVETGRTAGLSEVGGTIFNLPRSQESLRRHGPGEVPRAFKACGVGCRVWTVISFFWAHMVLFAGRGLLQNSLPNIEGVTQGGVEMVVREWLRQLLGAGVAWLGYDKDVRRFLLIF